MTSYYLVEESEGKNWKSHIDMRKQNDWNEHAKFMDNLESEGFIVLGGPLYTESDKSKMHVHTALLIIDASDENTLRTKLAEDPWLKKQILKISWIKKWDILLNRDTSVR